MPRCWLIIAFLLCGLAHGTPPVMQYTICPEEKSCSLDADLSDATWNTTNWNSSIFLEKSNFNSKKALVVKCTASEPLRWVISAAFELVADVSIQLDQAKVISSAENQGNVYNYRISFRLRSKRKTRIPPFLGGIRCESYSNATDAAELQVATDINKIIANWVFLMDRYFAFLPSPVDGPDGFRLLCPTRVSGEELKVFKAPVADKIVYGKVSEGCIKCLCEQIGCTNFSECNLTTNSTTKCGPLQLSYQYWNEAGKPVLNGENPAEPKAWQNCLNSLECAAGTFGKKLVDVNDDGHLSCSDLLQAHDAYVNNTTATPTAHPEFQACLNSDLMEISHVDKLSAHLGFRISGAPDYNSTYVCGTKNAQGGKNSPQIRLVPLLPENKVQTSLYYFNGSEGKDLKGIVCQVEEHKYGNVHLNFLPCQNVSSCQLQVWSHMGFMRLAGDGKVGKRISRLSPQSGIIGSIIPHDQEDPLINGIVECQYRWYSGKYAQQLGYIFKGVDSKLHFFSNDIMQVSESGMIQTTLELVDSSRENYIIRCRISTFAIFPIIQYGVEFPNGTIHQILEDESDTPWWSLGSLVQYVDSAERVLTVYLGNDAAKISCSAPLAYSKTWITQALIIDELIFGGNMSFADRGQGVEEDEEKQRRTMIVIALVTSGLVLLLAIISIVLLNKYLRAKKKLRDLTAEEMIRFHEGSKSFGSLKDLTKAENVDVDCIAFPKEYVIAPDHLKIMRHEVLGDGQYGTCVRGEFQGKSVAVKMTKSSTEVEYFKSFLTEVKIMAYIGAHENVIGFDGAVVERIKERLCQVVVELSPYGDLLNLLKQNAKSFSKSLEDHEYGITLLEETEPRLRLCHLESFCSQIAAGMEFLAAKKIVHGDLAARNVLVFDNFTVKITDFGLSTKLYETSNYKKKRQMPLPYRWMALESLKYLEFSMLSDVWSFGITVWEIFTLGQVPFSMHTWSEDFIEHLERGLRPCKPPLATDEIYQFMMTCWRAEPSERPSFGVAKTFFKTSRFRETPYGA